MLSRQHVLQTLVWQHPHSQRYSKQSNAPRLQLAHGFTLEKHRISTNEAFDILFSFFINPFKDFSSQKLNENELFFFHFIPFHAYKIHCNTRDNNEINSKTIDYTRFTMTRIHVFSLTKSFYNLLTSLFRIFL